MNDLYQQANYFANAEDAVLDQYPLRSGSQSRANFRATAQKLLAVLQTVGRDGDAEDRAFVQSVLEKQTHYLLLADQFLVLVDTHHTTRGIALYDALIEPLSNHINEQTAMAANKDYQIATRSLADLDRTQQIVVALTTLVFAVGLFLLTVFWRVMRRYQRQLDEAKQAELVRMEQIALTDPLTGLPNHRTMMDQIEEELARCQSTQQSCAVVFVDLDHFKRINDTWGHRAGDAVLCEVGHRLKEKVRQDEAVGRYGGEEFVLVLTNTDLREAKQRAERLRVVLAEEPCLLSSEGGTLAETVIPITASIGVALYQEHGTTRAALIEAADRAMYYAKQTGRDRVCLAGEETALMPQVLSTLPKGQLSETVTVQTLTAVASIHDGKTSAHAHRMVRLAEATARRLGRSEEEVHLVRLAALFHDIGRIGVPDAILHKPGPLTEEEWTVMRRQPMLGRHILVQVGGIFELLSHIVVAHHERWDGHGYPHGLAQSAIPLGARILSAVDSYDAMISERPYRPALSEAEARAELERGAGSQFDPQVVEAFLHVLDAQEEQVAPVLLEEVPRDATPSPTREELLDRDVLRP